MQINHHNYEVFFIDHIDGKLTPSQEEDLQVFLESNPDLALELDGLANIHLEAPETTIPNGLLLLKKDLHCGIDNRLDYLCIAKTEGDITVDEEVELQQMISRNEKHKHTYDNYRRLSLSANAKTVYPNKSAIKRVGFVNLTYKTLITLSGSVAAGLVIVFGLSIGLTKYTKVAEQQLASTIENTDVFEEMIEPINTEKHLAKPAVENPPVLIIPKQSKATKVERKNEELQIALQSVENESDFEIKIISTIELAEIPQSVTIDNNKPLIPLVGLYIESEMQKRNEGANQSSGVREIGLFELAQMGFNKLSNATGRTLNLNAQKDNEGNIKKIDFESELFALSIPVRRK